MFDSVGDEKLIGPRSVGAPGSLKAWCETLRRFGTMSLADVMQPAIKHASRGYAATPYLHECITDCASEMIRDKPLSKIYLPDGKAAEGRRARGAVGICGNADLHLPDGARRRCIDGPLGDILVDYMKQNGGFIAREDLTRYKTVERQPIRADYRGWEILGSAAARGIRRAHRADAQHSRRL